jgi:hypothetical protein
MSKDKTIKEEIHTLIETYNSKKDQPRFCTQGKPRIASFEGRKRY